MLKNTVAVITGASSGIGYELAKVFAENGFDLIIAAEDSKIENCAQDFRAMGVSVTAVQTDLSKPEGVDRLYDVMKQSLKPVEAVAMNAGIGVGGTFIDIELSRELELIQLNIVSIVHLMKHVLKDFVARGRGKILLTSSLAAEMPGPYYAVYAASKSFIQSFAEALRVEVKDSGVTITALQPGATDTRFFERADMLDTKAGQSKKDDPADVARDGYQALMDGKDHVVAGSFMNAVQSTMAKFITESQGAKMQGQQTKPTSNNH